MGFKIVELGLSVQLSEPELKSLKPN